jgi:UDP-N-acetylmuramoylalanine-D-glutamate ligase
VPASAACRKVNLSPFQGVDWTPFVEVVRAIPPHAVVCMGGNGVRIVHAPRGAHGKRQLTLVDKLADVVAAAKAVTPTGSVILLSPGAPSYDQFKEYVERGGWFAEWAGFDGAAIVGIVGAGIR